MNNLKKIKIQLNGKKYQIKLLIPLME